MSKQRPPDQTPWMSAPEYGRSLRPGASFNLLVRDVEKSVSNEIHQTTAALENAWADAEPPPFSGGYDEGLSTPPAAYKHPKKNWRLKRGAMPQWYKQRHGVRSRAQSGAARVARFRPPRSGSST